MAEDFFAFRTMGVVFQLDVGWTLGGLPLRSRI